MLNMYASHSADTPRLNLLKQLQAKTQTVLPFKNSKKKRMEA